ncbi:hypothetical protein [Kribbella pratensis]|uniref:Uncharacterized protein n=1 Tax=Kribbella pratensis TaxID=2512112 RepID=A0A4R8CMR3_9ACTN|nr:hypothetical protein [Kribbella pratensis]TDW77382.1 hypothetical protein EV653_2548 [Kribbella pratensis]
MAGNEGQPKVPDLTAEWVEMFTNTPNPLSERLQNLEESGADTEARAAFLRGELHKLTRKDGPSK